jgi:hypothetical protein
MNATAITEAISQKRAMPSNIRERAERRPRAYTVGVNEQRPQSRTWVWFSVIRIGLFAVVLTVLLFVLPVEPWISTVVAAVIAFCLSFLFLGRPRAELARQLDRARRGEQVPKRAPSDDDVEDAAIDHIPDIRG